jgi:hypothetical protein
MKRTILAAALALMCGTVMAQSNSGRAIKEPAFAATEKPVVNEQSQRYALVHKIVKEWGPYVQAVHGENIMQWADRLVPTLRRADSAKLLAASQADTFESMINALTAQKTISLQSLPGGIAPKALGSTTGDLVFTPLASCNLLDTRNAGGVFTAGVSRHFKGSGANFTGQGGSATNCGIPDNPTALLLGVTAVNPVNKGYFKLWPYQTTQPASSSMSYGPTQNSRNDIVLKVSQGLSYDFSAAASTSGGHLLVSVLGYYSAPYATKLDCLEVLGSAVDNPAGAITDATVSCPTSGSPFFIATHTASGGGCFISNSSGGQVVKDSRRYQSAGIFPNSGWTCSVYNGGGSTYFLQSRATCCRVPGR